MKVKYVNQPRKEGGKFGNIKMESGETFFVNVGSLNRYSVGMEINPPHKPEKWGDNVVNVIPTNYDPNAQPAPAAAPPAAAPAPAPRPAMNGAGKNDLVISALALMKSFIETSQFGLTDLPALEEACLASARRLQQRSGQ